MVSISVFNNKGGVGKTTLLCNIAAFLKSLEKKVLIVDADPQCNASTYVFPEAKLEFFIFEEKSTVGSLFEPVQKGEGFLPLNSIPIKRSIGFNTDVLVGDPQLSVLEDFLSNDWLDARGGNIRGLKTTLVFYDFLLKVSDRYDYVLFDVGPSLGAINRSILLACDYFLIPMSTDIFSLQAIGNIAKSVNNWRDQLAKGIAEYEKNGERFVLNDHIVDAKPSFIGYVTQQYIAKSVAGVNRPVKAYEQIINLIPNTIRQELSGLYCQGIDDSLSLGSIPNFNSLIPLSQMANKPIFALGGKDGVVGAHFAKVKDYESVISIITNNLLNNIEKYDNLA